MNNPTQTDTITTSLEDNICIYNDNVEMTLDKEAITTTNIIDSSSPSKPTRIKKTQHTRDRTVTFDDEVTKKYISDECYSLRSSNGSDGNTEINNNSPNLLPPRPTIHVDVSHTSNNLARRNGEEDGALLSSSTTIETRNGTLGINMIDKELVEDYSINGTSSASALVSAPNLPSHEEHGNNRKTKEGEALQLPVCDPQEIDNSTMNQTQRRTYNTTKIKSHNLQHDFGVGPRTDFVGAGNKGFTRSPSMRRHDDEKLSTMKADLANRAWNSSTPDSMNYSSNDDDDSTSSAASHKGHRPNKKNKRMPTIQESEHEARQKAISNKCTLFLLEGYSSAKVFIKYLLSLNSLFGSFLSAGFTILCYNKTLQIEGWKSGVDWVLLSFAVIMPMSVSLGYSFRRRDVALFDIAAFRANAVQIYLCFALWKWKDMNEIEDDRQTEWLNFCDTILEQLIGISDELCRFLTLPTATTSRHRVTKRGKREAATTIEVAYRLFDSLYTTRITKLNIICQLAGDSGFTVSEGSRIQSWTRDMLQSMDNLRVAKMYRTPEALRSFAMLFTTLLPPFYAPNFAQVAHDSNSLALGVSFAIITSLALTALFNSIIILEDPFIAYITLDGIDCREEFSVLFWHQLINARKMIFPWAFPFPKYRVDETGFVKGFRAIEGSARSESILSKDALAGLDIRVSAYTALPNNDSLGIDDGVFHDEEMGGVAGAGASTRSLRSRSRTLSSMISGALKSNNTAT